MARADIINMLYSAHKTPLDFQFQSLQAPPLLSLISPYDIKQLNDLARDPKLSAKLNKKLEYIKSILEPRGFTKFHSGTNRIVYKFYEDQNFLIKIALDKTGLSDNPMEYQNQFLLMPFITKVFESSPCGTVGLFERVEPITSRQEFVSIAEDVFDLLNDKIIGEYVLEDVGTEYFMNWGIRKGFGPVLLDFPYCYKLDGNRLYCNQVDPTTMIECGGTIDYDLGFNNLVCTKCGKKYFARDLQSNINKQKIILKGRKETSTMKVQCFIGNELKSESNTVLSAKTYADNIRNKKASMKVDILNNHPPIDRAEEVRKMAFNSKNKIQQSQEMNESKILNDSLKETLPGGAHEIYARNSYTKLKAPYAKQENTTNDYVKMNQEESESSEDIENIDSSEDYNSTSMPVGSSPSIEIKNTYIEADDDGRPKKKEKLIINKRQNNDMADY